MNLRLGAIGFACSRRATRLTLFTAESLDAEVVALHELYVRELARLRASLRETACACTSAAATGPLSEDEEMDRLAKRVNGWGRSGHPVELEPVA